MKKQSVLLLLFFAASLDASLRDAWYHGKAVTYGQEDKWHDAQQQLQHLMVDQPERADLVYDNGVAAYRLGEFATAAAYFDHVTQIPNVSLDLKKQAHFNLGNTNVALQQLPQAIAQYEKVLAIEPNNTAAQHNLAKVKEMLKQQQQKQQKQDNKDNQDGAQSPQNNNNQSGNNQQNNSSPEQHDTSPQEPSSGTGDQEKKENARNKQKGQEKREADNKSRDKKGEQEQNNLRNNHASSSQQSQQQQTTAQRSKDNSQPINNEHKEQGIQKGAVGDPQKEGEATAALEQQFKAEEQWMVRALAQQEKADKKAQKAFMKANVNKQLAGQDGQNCW